MLVTKNNYVNILGWMIDPNGMNLQGKELIAFAVIHGFSMCDTYCKNCENYISEWIHESVPETYNILDDLIEKNFILKREDSDGNRFYKSNC